MLKQITVVLFVMFGYVVGSNDSDDCFYYKAYGDCAFLELNCELCPEDDYCDAFDEMCVEEGTTLECEIPYFPGSQSMPSILQLGVTWPIDCVTDELKLQYTCNNGVFDVTPVCVTSGAPAAPAPQTNPAGTGTGCHVDDLPNIANEAGTNVEIADGETATVCCGPGLYLQATVECTEDGPEYVDVSCEGS